MRQVRRLIQFQLVIFDIADVVVVLHIVIVDAIAQSLQAMNAVVQMKHYVLASTVMIGVVEELCDFLRAQGEAVFKSVRIRLGLDVEFVLALQVVEMADSELKDVCLLKFSDVLFAFRLE